MSIVEGGGPKLSVVARDAEAFDGWQRFRQHPLSFPCITCASWGFQVEEEGLVQLWEVGRADGISEDGAMDLENTELLHSDQ